MNDEEMSSIETVAKSWTVETTDLTARVAAAIGATVPPSSEMSELVGELRSLRLEIKELQRVNIGFQEEMFRLRLELTGPTSNRIAPYASSESFVRFW